MAIFRQFTANSISMKSYPFWKELAMEAYLLENEDIFQRWGHKRHDIKEEEVIQLQDQTISTCNQWNPENIKSFISQAENLGWMIELK